MGGLGPKKHMHGRGMSIMDIFWNNIFQLEQEIKRLMILYSTSSISKARKPPFTSTPYSPFTTEKVDNPKYLYSALLLIPYLMRIRQEVRMVQDVVCGATNTHPTHVAKFRETFPAPDPHFFGKIHRLHLEVKE